MKKLSLAALALITTFTSCMNGETSSSEQYVVLLTSIESNGTQNSYTWDFGYSEIDSMKVKTKLEFRSAPVLREQIITGDNISKIAYGYSKTALTMKVSSQNGITTDSIKYDSKLNAAELYVNEKPTPYFIKYDTEGFRTQVNDVNLKPNNFAYQFASQNDIDIVSYEYMSVVNTMGIQQFGIYGSKYFWPTGRFGLQSRYLLNSFKTTENGEAATYKFKYEFNENGLIKDETITRNDQPFMTNKYTYKVGIIRY